VPTLYQTLCKTVDALESGETGTAETSTMVEWTQREARWGERRSEFRHE